MGIETEVKIRVQDTGEFCRRLSHLGARALSARHFEDNRLVDFPDGRLQSSRSLIRIRQAGERFIFTYKGPPEPEGLFKTREELETGIENGDVLLEAFERIGMSVCFRYQKYRQEFALGDVLVAVDETPIGNFVELEGSEAGIRGLALKMNLNESEFIRSSYHSLYVEHCHALGRAPGMMVF